MKRVVALKIVLIISLAGLIFSGYLSFTELFLQFCGANALGMGVCTNVFQIPACVYGFVMYLALFVVSLMGLYGKK